MGMGREKYNLMGKSVFFMIFFCVLFIIGLYKAHAQQDFFDHCYETYEKEKKCPEKICKMKTCSEEEKEKGCEDECLPKACTEMPPDECPVEFCNIMVNCAGEEMCHYRMPAESPSCGDMAYEGQEIECCEGFVRRCGVQFLDDTCDMIGENSMYNLPICIPCGDDHCSQFENACNCPEDCGEGKYQGFDLKKYLESKKKPDKKNSWMNKIIKK